MPTTSEAVRQALDALIANSVTADQKLIASVLPRLVDLAAEGDRDAIRDFFRADPEGLRLFLEKGTMPSTFAGQRFAAMFPQLLEMLNAIHAGEAAQVDAFLASEGMTPTERAAVYRGSLFMAPSIKAAILREWVEKPWKGHSLSSRVWDFSKLSEDALLKLVASGIADGKSPKALKPVVQKVFTDQSNYAVRRLLLTESSRIWHDVQSMAVKEFKHIKYVVLKYGNRHNKDCECTPYKNRGKILYADAPTLPLHPNSSSYLQPVAG